MAVLRPFVQLGWCCHTFRPAVGCWAILSMLLAKWENCQRRRARAGVSAAKVNADAHPSHVHTAVLKSEIPLTVPTLRFIYLKLSGINLLESLRLGLYRTGRTEKKEGNRAYVWCVIHMIHEQYVFCSGNRPHRSYKDSLPLLFGPTLHLCRTDFIVFLQNDSDHKHRNVSCADAQLEFLT